MSVLIKNGRIITATDDYISDIFIEGETISAVGKGLAVKADTTIDATGLLVMPGGIDPHVHLDMPFMGTFSSDTHETGTRAALFGGDDNGDRFCLAATGPFAKRGIKGMEWPGLRAPPWGIIVFIWRLRILMTRRRRK